MDLLEIDNVFSILQIQSDRTTSFQRSFGRFRWKSTQASFVLCYAGYPFSSLSPSIDWFFISINYQGLRNLIWPSSSISVLEWSHLLFGIELILSDLSLYFILNILSNLTHSKNSFRYKQPVKDSTAFLYIWSGCTVYEFLRYLVFGRLYNHSNMRIHPIPRYWTLRNSMTALFRSLSKDILLFHTHLLCQTKSYPYSRRH